MAWDFLVAKTDLRRAEVREIDPPALAEGEARLAIERFALTANNITYGVFGQAMRYWDFFPGPEGWGRIPVWGHARVEASNHPDLAVGQRFYGYWPMSTHLTVTPRKTRTVSPTSRRTAPTCRRSTTSTRRWASASRPRTIRPCCGRCSSPAS
jgi:hypothetical protein